MTSLGAISSSRLRFGKGYELDVGAYELRRAGRALKLPHIPMELLLLLIEQRGNVVTRDQIIERIWGKVVFVDTDNSINAAVRKIRQVLRDDVEEPRFIQTVTAKGYRFIAPVTEIEGIPREKPVARPSTTASDATREAEKIDQGQVSFGPEAQTTTQQTTAATRQHVWRRWRMVLAIVLVVLAGVGFYPRLLRRQTNPPSPNSRVMLAVLPFDNLTGDAGQEYFSDGMTEEITTELGRINPEQLGVIARTSVMLYKHNPKPLDRVGRELGVQYVVEGSIRRDSDYVRITAQLIRVKDQTHVWARQFDRELKNLLVVQREIAQEIADEIQLTLDAPRQLNATNRRVPVTPITSYEAYDLYLKGNFFWNKRTPEALQQAAVYFQQAINKDPNYARAYSGLADALGLMSTWHWAPQNEFMPKARTAALKALQVDETLAEAHTSLALVAENYDYDWPTAEKQFLRAIQLNPDYATGHQWYAEYLSWQGRLGEALAESERARQLDPLSLIIATDHGRFLYYSRQYDRAITQCRAVLDIDPKFPTARGFVVYALVEEGRFPEALDELEQVGNPQNSPWTWAWMAYLYGRWGRTAEAENALKKFEDLAPRLRADRAAATLLAYAGTGRKDQTIGLLRKAYAEHSSL
ncbi:MAG TPA: winged helix-turn-helix domain-containing protein, partial [Candidatus Sulfotelmatobacter sp.]|nr:winged helix-turn-helix domain-containing protein [Candidatus Sulfotelmatobacter sp.]